MKKEEGDLLIGLLDGIQEELDVLWERVSSMERTLSKLEKGFGERPADNRYGDMWERLLMLDQIITKNRPDWVGKWEEEHCEGGGRCPQGGKTKKSKGTFKRWLRKIRKQK